MKNITLFLEKEVIADAHSYDQKHQTTFNQLVGDLLKGKVRQASDKKGIDRIFELFDRHPSPLENDKFHREEIYHL